MIESIGKRNSQFNRQYYKYYNRIVSESRLKSSWVAAVENAVASGLNMRAHSRRNFTFSVVFYTEPMELEKKDSVFC